MDKSIPALPGNPGSNLILVTEIEIQFVFLYESRKLPRIQQYDLAVHVVIWAPHVKCEQWVRSDHRSLIPRSQEG
jgi:hypothetical protein